jgi:RNA polymerase sigma-70 factor, ECF subfamily
LPGRRPPIDPLPPTHAPMDDARMRAGIRLRDPAALAAAYQEYWGRLYRQARLMLPRDLDPEDMASHVLARAVERCDEYDPAQPIYPWLARICTHLCLNRKRRFWRRVKGWFGRDWAAGHDVAGHTPHAPTVQHARASLRDALAELPSRQGEVIALRYLFQLEPDQVASLLKMERGTVATAICRGLAQLRKNDQSNGRLRGLWETFQEGETG